jgi:hypothetical protein
MNTVLLFGVVSFLGVLVSLVAYKRARPTITATTPKEKRKWAEVAALTSSSTLAFLLYLPNILPLDPQNSVLPFIATLIGNVVVIFVGVTFTMNIVLVSIHIILAKDSTKTTNIPDNDRPPYFAEYLLYYLPKKIREPLLADLEEEYREISTRFGKRKATIWYYVQVALSYWPLLFSGVRKLIKWGVLGWLGGVVQRLIS